MNLLLETTVQVEGILFIVLRFCSCRQFSFFLLQLLDLIILTAAASICGVVYCMLMVIIFRAEVSVTFLMKDFKIIFSIHYSCRHLHFSYVCRYTYVRLRAIARRVVCSHICSLWPILDVRNQAYFVYEWMQLSVGT